MDNIKKGFSLVELLISLIVISCITAAFTPLITKKFSSGVFGGSISDISADCEKFGPNCNLCTSNICLSCTGLTCARDEYKDNKSCSCKKCIDKFGADCTKCNEDKCLTCPSGQYLNRDDNCVSCTTKFSDCATCNEDQCLSCKDGKILTDPTSTTPCSNFTCSSPDFMQIGNLCITKKNMGDSDSLTISGGVNVVDVGTTCDVNSANFCCWKGNTAGTCNNENGGGYSGCNRTVCDHWAAEKICDNFHAGNFTWRLPTATEMSNWGINSINTGTLGLQFCDDHSGYSSALCQATNKCLGSDDGYCYPNGVWSKELDSSAKTYYYYLNSGNWVRHAYYNTRAHSTRCVATMPQSCTQRAGAGCLACDGATCLSCDTGYVLKNGKCEPFDCSGDDFIQVGNLCVTKKNMGDGDELKIPSGVNVVNTGSTCSPSSTNFCCWKGNTISTCDNGNDGYSGCNRTVCDHYAADYICKNFHAGDYTWRLAKTNEMLYWGVNSKYVNHNALQLCDYYSNNLSATCADSRRCPGAYDDSCSPNDLWSNEVLSSTIAYSYYLTNGNWNQTNYYERSYAYSVRCVTEMPESCAQKTGQSKCTSCNGSTCLSCDSEAGYVLRNGKCENTFCKGSDFMLIGNLCITRKNMGDSATLNIPSGVNVVNVGTTCNPSSTNFCCWKGQTANPCDNANGGGYSGCNRTACDWWAADYICKNFNYNGLYWRLPTIIEMNNWDINSKNLGINGLQLCDILAGYNSAFCQNVQKCNGSYNGWCTVNQIWSGTCNDFNNSKSFILYGGAIGSDTRNNMYSYSVRCVTEL